MSMEYATVKIGDYTIPLIGVPADATEETCAKCGNKVHLSEMTLDAQGQLRCLVCLVKS